LHVIFVYGATPPPPLSCSRVERKKKMGLGFPVQDLRVSKMGLST